MDLDEIEFDSNSVNDAIELHVPIRLTGQQYRGFVTRCPSLMLINIGDEEAKVGMI